MKIFEAFENNQGWNLVELRGTLDAQCNSDERVRRTVVALSAGEPYQVKWYDKRGALARIDRP